MQQKDINNGNKKKRNAEKKKMNSPTTSHRHRTTCGHMKVGVTGEAVSEKGHGLNGVLELKKKKVNEVFERRRKG